MVKKGHVTGFLKGLFFSSKLNEISSLVMLQKAIDTEEWKKDGCESVKDFCREVTGVSYDTVHRRLETIKTLGTEVVSILVSLNRGVKDAKLIEHALIEDTAGKKGLKIDDRVIAFEEDKKDEIQVAIDLLKERREAEKKEAKRLQGKVESLAKEHKKESEAMQKEIERLNALDPSKDDISNQVKKAEVVQNAAHEFAGICNKIVFDGRLADDEHIVIRAKAGAAIQEALDVMRTLANMWHEKTYREDVG